MGNRYCPDAEHRYFIYDPEGDGLSYFPTAEERDAASKKIIAAYSDHEGWSEEVEQVIAGEVTHKATACYIQQRPATLDENGCDEAGVYWDVEAEIRCNYKLLELTPATHQTADPVIPETQQ